MDYSQKKPNKWRILGKAVDKVSDFLLKNYSHAAVGYSLRLTVVTGAIVAGAVSSYSMICWGQERKPLSQRWAPYYIPIRLVERTREEGTRIDLYRFAMPETYDTLGYQPIASCELNFADGTVFPARRYYTPITHPEQRGFVEFAVKHHEPGRMCRQLRALKAGDIVWMTRWLREWKYRPNEYEEIGFIAANSGVTPALQLLNVALADASDATKFSLLLCGQSPTEIPFRQKLVELQSRFPERLKVSFVNKTTRHLAHLGGKSTMVTTFPKGGAGTGLGLNESAFSIPASGVGSVGDLTAGIVTMIDAPISTAFHQEYRNPNKVPLPKRQVPVIDFEAYAQQKKILEQKALEAVPMSPSTKPTNTEAMSMLNSKDAKQAQGEVLLSAQASQMKRYQDTMKERSAHKSVVGDIATATSQHYSASGTSSGATGGSSVGLTEEEQRMMAGVTVTVDPVKRPYRDFLGTIDIDMILETMPLPTPVAANSSTMLTKRLSEAIVPVNAALGASNPVTDAMMGRAATGGETAATEALNKPGATKLAVRKPTKVLVCGPNSFMCFLTGRTLPVFHHTYLEGPYHGVLRELGYPRSQVYKFGSTIHLQGYGM